MGAPDVTDGIWIWVGARRRRRRSTVLLSMTPSFRAPPASWEQFEDLLSVQGVDRYCFTAASTERSGRMIAHAGVEGCLSVLQSRRPQWIEHGGKRERCSRRAGTPGGVGSDSRQEADWRRSGSPRWNCWRRLFGRASAGSGWAGVGLHLRATARTRRQDGVIRPAAERDVDGGFQLKMYEDGYHVCGRGRRGWRKDVVRHCRDVPSVIRRALSSGPHRTRTWAAGSDMS